MNYRFSDEAIQERFDQLVEDIRREVLQAQFGNLMGAMQNLTPDDVARMRQMLSELNEMVRARDARRTLRLRRLHGALRRHVPGEAEEPGRAA